MSLGERIEERRKAVGISQAELARRIGVRQSTINSLVNGNSRTSRSLLQIARELGTTAAYLTGETDNPLADLPNHEVALSAEEREWVDLLRSVELADRKAALQLIRTIAMSAKSVRHHE